MSPVSFTQTLDTLTCSYVNATNTIQVGRIANIEHWYFERVIFPGQRLIFEAPDDSVLEIYTSQCANAILAERIPCQNIKINNSGTMHQ